jgi:hypothetical protein
MSELSNAAKALLSKHKEGLGAWPNIRYIVFAFCDERMIRGVEDQKMVEALPPLLELIDKFLTEGAEDSKEALMVLESLGESFIDMVKHIERKVGATSLTAV